MLGVVRVAEGVSFVMADIPGVIEGASEGAGLGHAFLRHVERCRLLIHVVDVSGSEGRDPITDFDTINRELRAFNPELAACPMLVAGNKCDLATDDQLDAFAAEMAKRGYAYFPIMAPIAHGTDELVKACARELQKLPPVRRFEPDAVPAFDVETVDRNAVTITREDEMYVVEADWLERVMRGINLDETESLHYFERVLQTSGVIQALRDAGCGEGDTVCIGDFAFDFVE